MEYDHTQTSPLYRLLVGVGIAMFVGGWLAPEMVVQIILFCSGMLMFLFALSFQHLTVSDEGDRLRMGFGPLPLFRRHVLYSEIERVEQARSTILDGWGIHLSLNGGWVWNLWGFDCVDVWHSKGTKTKKVRIGTDDPVDLAAFLKERVGQKEQ